MMRVGDVAAFILDNVQPITTMKLQKLVFFTHKLRLS